MIKSLISCAPAVALLFTACAGFSKNPGESYLPPASLNLKLEAPIDRWDEAVPLGNGLTGGLLWGEGRLIRLSLDRGDLWDLRVPEMLKRDDWTWATIKKLVAERRTTASWWRCSTNPTTRSSIPPRSPPGAWR